MSLNELLRGCTSFVIAHRLVTRQQQAMTLGLVARLIQSQIVASEKGYTNRRERSESNGKTWLTPIGHWSPLGTSGQRLARFVTKWLQYGYRSES